MIDVNLPHTEDTIRVSDVPLLLSALLYIYFLLYSIGGCSGGSACSELHILQ